jgi:hypothetical protein
MMKTALYTLIEPPTQKTVEWVIIEAQRRCGITLVPFNGWTDSDLGMPGNPGIRMADHRANAVLLREIEDATVQPHGDYAHIADCCLSQSPRFLEDNEAAQLLHAIEPWTVDSDL